MLSSLGVNVSSIMALKLNHEFIVQNHKKRLLWIADVMTVAVNTIKTE